MPEHLIIRDSLAEDMPSIHEIYALEVTQGTASFELEPPGLEEMQRRRETLLAGAYPYLVAELAGRLAGYAYAGPYRPRPAYRNSVENSVYIARWAHRQGVGFALLEALIDACETRGFRQMIAIIGDSAHAASIRLHEKAGFRMVGYFENVGFKFGRWLDTVLMQRTLGDGAKTLPVIEKTMHGFY